MTIKCEKISIRVEPLVKRGLKRLAEDVQVSLAELIRGCINESLEGVELPQLNDLNGWERFMKES
jgi:hypothetical protein